MPLVNQELLTFLEHLSSSPVFSEVHVTRSLVFCVVFCRSLFVLLAIVLSVLWFTTSDYSNRILNLNNTNNIQRNTIPLPVVYFLDVFFDFQLWQVLDVNSPELSPNLSVALMSLVMVFVTLLIIPLVLISIEIVNNKLIFM